MNRPGVLLLLCWLCCLCLAPTAGAQEGDASVGVPRWKRDLVIEGSEVEVRPADNLTIMVLRIADSYPHGSAFRYDIEYYGLEPGEYNLLNFLRRKDGSSLEAVAPIPVLIVSSLPPDVLRPNAIESGDVPTLGGYTLGMWLLGALWVAGLVAILTMGRKHAASAHAARSRPKTLAERLRPLVEQGLAGQLNAEDSAQLELTLIAFWRRKLGLQDQNSSEALQELKRHAEAGPLLRQLELWLHSPGGGADVNLTELLAPYNALPADAFDVPDAYPTPAQAGASA